MEISEIQDKVKKDDYRLSDHAVKKMIQRLIEGVEIKEAVLNGEIIEEYPQDKYSPSCLLYGETNAGRVLHIQISLPPKVVVITTYEPSSEKWIKGRIRR